MFHSTVAEDAVTYRLDTPVAPEAEPVGTTARAGLASFLGCVERLGVWRTLAQRVRLPMQERCTGFTHLQKSQVLLAGLVAGCRRARDSDFTLAADPAAVAALGLPRWPHSSQLTRHLRAFRPQHVAALRHACEEILATHSRVRQRVRRAPPGRPSRRYRLRSDGDQRQWPDVSPHGAGAFSEERDPWLPGLGRLRRRSEW